MRKRALSLFLSAVMVGSLVAPMGSITALAATTAENLVVAESVKADVDKVKFTHNEWTGTDYTDVDGNEVTGEDVFGIAREDASVPKIPYQDTATAVGAVWDYNGREDSVYFDLLTGKDESWELTVVQNQMLAQKFMGEDGFMTADFAKDEADGWKDVTLPMSWTMQGFDFSIYVNTGNVWQTDYDPRVTCPESSVNYNPVGLYRKTFTVSDEMKADDRRVYLSFQGVESAYYVYVNGKEVGYSEDSYSPHRFDVTDYLVDGENLLAVKVHKFCDGTWMEKQDMIYDGGIFRDVYLTSEPLVQIQDYVVTTDLDENYEDAVLSVAADIRNLSSSDQSGWTIDVQAFDEAGTQIVAEEIAVDEVASTETASFNMQTTVENPELWSAEKPNLYALVLTLKDGEGNVVENLSTQLGFREFSFTRTEVDENGRSITTEWDSVKINGQNLLLKGANRHDTDPIYGKACTQESMFEDMKLMKQYNLNAVRTAHYSNDEYWYWLCNKYGLYNMAETNLECHSIQSNNGYISLFYELMMDRTETTFKRLRNNPAIFSWSLGNEMAYTNDKNFGNGIFFDMIWYFKNNDPTRMVHSEGQHGAENNPDGGGDLGVDMFSNMYRNIDHVRNRGGEGRIPYVMCEYAHAMGNSLGNMMEYWDSVRSNDETNLMGGFVWDWVDQARAKELSDLGTVVNVTDKTGVVGEIADDGTWNTEAEEGSLTGNSFSGSTLFDDAKFNEALSGTGKSFTFEVVVKPNSFARNQIFLAKGDNQISLKTHNNSDSLEFFVYDGTWKSTECAMPENWVGNWHQVVGVYDAGVMQIYVDGELMVTNEVEDGINAGDWKLGVGYDDQNNRGYDGEISLARIYTKALTAEEIAAQNSATPTITAEDDSVLLWVDYSDGYTEGESPYWDYYSEDFAQQNLYDEEMDGKFMAYGGDWGDKPNDGSYMQNGMISADRTPQPELMEGKYVWQSFWFTADVEDLNNRTINVYNEYNFTNLNEYNVSWELIENGLVIDKGTVTDTDVAPKSNGTITVPFTMPEDPDAGNEYYLNISVTTKEATDWAEAGHEQGWEQIPVIAAVEQAPLEVIKTAVAVEETDDAYEIVGENFSFEINKANGVMQNYVYGGETLVEVGPAPNFWRGLMENDTKYQGFDRNWKNKEKNIRVDSIDVTTNGDGLNVITANLVFPDAGNAKETIVYTINGGGQVTIDMTVDARNTGMGNFIRVGSLATLPAGFETLTWYGNGPVETLYDRNFGGRQGIWSSTANEMFFPYEAADDTGTITETVWMKLEKEGLNNALLVVAEDAVEVSALHFTPDDLDAARHPYELTPRDETILSINYGSMGTGGATCGPATLDKYRLPSGTVYNWAFTLMPVAAGAEAAEVYEATKGYHVVDSSLATIIAPESVTVQDDHTATINITVMPESALETIRWSSADESIATVDQNGNITGVNEGTTVVTVYSAYDESIKAEIAVTVTPNYALVEELQDKIDNFLVYAYSQLEEAEAIVADIEGLSETLSALIGDEYVARAAEILEEVKALEGKATYLQDLSKNAMVIPLADTASFVKSGDKVYMHGYLPVPYNEIMTPVLSGDEDFSIEVNATVMSGMDMNILASKGDNAVALRTRQGQWIDYHVYAGGAWRDCKYELPAEERADFLGKEHNFVAVYKGNDVDDIDGDGDLEEGVLELYIDGELKQQAATNTAEGVAESNYELNVGACVQTNRTSDNNFSSIRIYTKALTAEEIAAQMSGNYAITAEDESVELWVELGDFKVEDGEEPVESPEIDPSKMTATAGDAETDGGDSEGPAALVLDGNVGTKWHTEWYPEENNTHENHWLELELDAVYTVDGFKYLPRQDRSTNGDITGYQIQVSLDGENWTTVNEGTWALDKEWKEVTFEAQNAKYVRLQTVVASSDQDNESGGYKKFAAAAEVRVTGVKLECAEHTTELRDVVEATCTEDGYTGNVVCVNCLTVVEAGEAIAASGHSYGEWVIVKEPTTKEDGLKERVCAACGDKEEEAITKLSADKTALEAKVAEYATVDTSVYTDESAAVLAAAITAAQEVIAKADAAQEEVDTALAALEAAYAALEEKTVDPTPELNIIPVSEMTATAGDEETENSDTSVEGPAGLAIDENESTFWHTDWYEGPNHDNHWLQLELNSAYMVDSFRYLPRQSNGSAGNTNGTVTAYKIQISTDGVNFTDVAEGTWAADSEWKSAEFEAVKAKYVRLKVEEAESDIGIALACAAEVRLTGAKVECTDHAETTVVGKKDATCTEAGYTGDTVCANCLTVVTEGTEIAMLEHTVVVDQAVEATCTEDGLTEGSHCSVCETVLVEQEEIAALGHTWGEWTGVKDATYEEDGLEERVCAACGEKEERKIDKLVFENPFEDVEEGKWYYDAVMWGAKNGIVNGLEATVFGPKAECSRGQIVTFLWRAEGEPKAESRVHSFTDVKEGKYYYEAMLWALEEGIITGYSDTAFGPEETCTRSQMATILWRHAGEENVEAEESPFADVKVGKWYYDAAVWASENGIVEGYDNGLFGTKDTVTRSQTVTMLYRYYSE